MCAKRLEPLDLPLIPEKSSTSRATGTPETIKKLLVPIKNLDFCDADSNYSELSDKYPDLYKEDCILRSYRSEKGESVLDEFTEDYKSTVKEIREELHVRTNF